MAVWCSREVVRGIGEVNESIAGKQSRTGQGMRCS